MRLFTPDSEKSRVLCAAFLSSLNKSNEAWRKPPSSLKYYTFLLFAAFCEHLHLNVKDLVRQASHSLFTLIICACSEIHHSQKPFLHTSLATDSIFYISWSMPQSQTIGRIFRAKGTPKREEMLFLVNEGIRSHQLMAWGMFKLNTISMICKSC